MSDVLAFFQEVVNKKDENETTFVSGGSKFFMPKLMLSLENEMYLFHVLDEGVDLFVHGGKFPEKDKPCPRKYMGEHCAECEKPSGYKNKRKDKETGEEIEVEGKMKPTRKRFMPVYLHNHTAGSRAKKNDSSVVYDTSPEVLADFACGEANTQTKLEKDRNIKGILSAKEMGVLYETLFMMRRKKVRDEKKNKDVNQTEWPQAVLPQAKLTYKIPRADQPDGYLTTTNKADRLMVPTDIKEKWDNMIVGEKMGLILNNLDLSVCTKSFWEEKGVIFPPEPEKKPEENKEDSKDI